MAQYAVIVVAAGKGERFGGAENKVFAKVDGRAMFLRSLEAFVNRDDVCQTILVVSPADDQQVRDKFGANLGFMGVQLATGGAERSDSVFNALADVRDDADYVAIHDAARPCISQTLIDTLFAEAPKSGAVIPAAPIFGTLKQIGESGVVESTVSRVDLWEAQTPQVFKRSLIREAYDKRGDFEGTPTDDAQLVEALNHPVSVVESNFTNIKITGKSDLVLANAIIRTLPKSAPKSPLSPFEEAQW
ncbi:MAG: 2-C-methyl-D-erythritol 4-phosphate cytidylyltransferase [Phycisphaerales bacterium]|nr:2-C-methyl-D-erythritol 4-phosphate cytidylyltransferase [Phycisphaerales bacterium]